MNAEIAALDSSTVIVGINEVGHESGNASMVEGHTTAWLQDVPDVDVWSSWNVTYRDVIILDANSEVADIVNTTVHDLREPDNYTMLLEAILAARP